MYVLINCSFDGDTYQIFTDREKAGHAFEDSLDIRRYHSLYLLEVEPDQEFGFGSRGEIYGAEVLEEWHEEEM